MTGTHRRSARRSRAAGAFGLLLVVSACGGGSSTTTAQDKDTLAPRVAVVQAAQQGTEVTSSRFALTSTSTIGGTDVEFGGEGAFNYASGNGEMRFTLPGGAGELRQLVVGEILYMQLPNEPGSFYELRLADLVDTSLAGTTDPTGGLQALEAANDDVVEVGRDEVRGRQTTHYRGTYDVKESLKVVKGATATLLQKTLGDTDLSAVPFDAYIDDEGRLVRMDQVLEITSPQQQGQKIQVQSRVELFDFGVKVNVTAPPAEQIKDGAPLLAMLKAAAGA